MAEGLVERLTQLEQAVRRAADLIARLRAERASLEKRERRIGGRKKCKSN